MNYFLTTTQAFICSFILLWSLSLSPLAAQESSQKIDVNEIIDQYVDAIGTSKARLKANTLEGKGKMKHGNAVLDAAVWIKAPYQIRLEIENANKRKVITGRSQDGEWTYMPSEKALNTSQESKNEISSIILFEDLTTNREKVKMEYVEEATVNKKATHHIKVEWPEEKVNRHYYISTETFLLVKLEDAYTGTHTWFDNYLAISGVMVPHYVKKQNLAAEIDFEIELEKVKLGKKLEDSFFDSPKQ